MTKILFIFASAKITKKFNVSVEKTEAEKFILEEMRQRRMEILGR